MAEGVINKHVKFVILSYPRTGSTLLVKNLNNLSEVVCHSEIYHEDYETFKRAILDKEFLKSTSIISRLIKNEERVYQELFQKRNRDFKSLVDRLNTTKNKFFGFKIFPGQNDEAFKFFLAESSFKKILLERENRLRSYVSQQIAYETGKWDRYKGEKASLTKLTIDFNHFLIYKSRIDNYLKNSENILLSSGQTYLKLTYEELIVDEKFLKVKDFLGIDDEAQINNKIDQEKQNPFKLHDIIINYHEVEEKLMSRNLASYLD